MTVGENLLPSHVCLFRLAEIEILATILLSGERFFTEDSAES